MDIQVASNFERLLYYILDEDSDRLNAAMDQISKEGKYKVSSSPVLDQFSSSRTSDEEIPSIIDGVYSQFSYVIDPHTACGFKRTGTKGVNIVLSTAHPAKFPETIQQAIGVESTSPSLVSLKTKKISKNSVEATEAAIKEFILSHI
jgi:threonine synthase